VIRFRKMSIRAKSIGLLGGLGVLLQFGGCELGTITTSSTTTLDGRDAITQIIRGAILTPLDAYITQSVDAAFGADDE
jgi:hypothetical protein